jgi:hypothetical protein
MTNLNATNRVSANTNSAAAAALGALAPTRPFTENASVSSEMRTLASRSRNGGAASVMLLPESGVKYDAYAFAYHTNLGKEMNIAGSAPAGSMFRGTLVVNVSGHDGAANAKKYAETNTYNVRVTLPNGKVLQALNIPRNDPNKAEYSTKIPVEFPLMPGKTIVESWPTGSAGVWGYVEGRRYSVNVGDQHQFDYKAANKAADAWERANPNAGSDGPQSPRPYSDF